MSFLEKLTGMKRTAVVHLRGEVAPVEVKPATKGADGKDVPAVVEPRLVGAVAVTVRGLSMHEVRVAHSAFDEPTPPLMKDPTKGSNAPPIPNSGDAAYLRQAAEYSDNTMAACVALATDTVKLTGDAGSDRAAIAAAVKTIRERLTSNEVHVLVNKMNELSAVHKGVEVALGNSSAGGTPTPA